MISNTNDKTTVAYFTASKAARDAADSIQDTGLGTPKVDILLNVTDGDPYYENPIILTRVQPTEYTRDKGESIQAENVFNESGESRRGSSDQDQKFMLTVSTPADKQGKVSEIISKHGGLV
ncbi:MAG: hypothetical protein PHY77_04290 [Desulfotomaculaceae bacterium]|nr:hypothetical protein [Desulfotomaculaceae bacterium]